MAQRVKHIRSPQHPIDTDLGSLARSEGVR